MNLWAALLGYIGTQPINDLFQEWHSDLCACCQYWYWIKDFSNCQREIKTLSYMNCSGCRERAWLDCSSYLWETWSGVISVGEGDPPWAHPDYKEKCSAREHLTACKHQMFADQQMFNSERTHKTQASSIICLFAGYSAHIIYTYQNNITNMNWLMIIIKTKNVLYCFLVS